MEHPGGSDHPLLGTLFGHRGRSEAVRAGRPLASLRELGELLAAIKEPRWPSSLRQALYSWPELAQLAHVAPRRTPRAKFSDKVLEGDDIDLAHLPIPDRNSAGEGKRWAIRVELRGSRIITKKPTTQTN